MKYKMSCAYDLHIHSCLSPCAADDMTPENIAGMAYIKGLSVISLTDHNTGENLAAMAKAAAKYNLIFVPGVEVTSEEEVHLLVYFSNVSNAEQFCSDIYQSLPEVKNRPNIFGNQIIMSDDDQPSRTLEKLLLQATSYPIESIMAMAQTYSGIVVPAHIDRDSFSLLSNLGYIPPGLFRCLEIRNPDNTQPYSSNFCILHSSDAHQLRDISEALHTMRTVKCPHDVISWLSGN